MAVRPARLPASEADLADWSVYADQLLQEADPLGEALAYDLSLPARPTTAEVGAFQLRFAQRCRSSDSAWRLGYARSVEIVGLDAIDMRSEPMGLLEEVVVTSSTTSAHVALAELPETCTCASSEVSWVDERPLLAMIAALPAHVTQLSLTKLPPLSAAVVGTLIDDRFERVAIYQADAAPIAQALRSTRRVGVDLGHVSGRLEHPRLRWGGFGGAGFVDLRARRGFELVRSSPIAAQRRFGLAPIRMQLERVLEETCAGRIGENEWVFLARHDARWTIRCERKLTIDGVKVAAETIVPLRDGAVVRSGRRESMFLTHDLDRRYRELI